MGADSGKSSGMSSFFALLFRLKYINRWGLMRSFRTENVSEHSLEVAMTAHALAEIGVTYFNRDYNPANIALKAMYHDVSEIFTGDLPTPIKYGTDDMKNCYKAIEKVAEINLLDKLPEELKRSYEKLILKQEDSREWRIVKAADKLCAYIKCLEEINSGNKEFTKAEEDIYKTLDITGIDELKYFMENFLPYFSNTIDEI
ncbi:MAG: 5'-deoxynucleotidase [Oscillospiraceae bacterium]|nr:5'-deoxynucleotidase [Oscillospiraceae bacterium]